MTITDSAEWDSPTPDLRVLVKPPHVLLAHNHNLSIILFLLHHDNHLMPIPRKMGVFLAGA